MPLPIRVVGSTLNRQPNITPESLLVRLENEDKVLELVEAPFKAAFATYSPFITFHLLCISLFPGSFDGPAGMHAIPAIIEISMTIHVFVSHVTVSFHAIDSFCSFST
jgi:hypothetical protein